MCLIFLAWRSHPDYPLVIAANRDEAHRRRTASADFWADAPHLLAGRDLEAGGTWLGVNRNGRFAALTNYREPGRGRSDAPSRGALVHDYLAGAMTAEQYLAQLEARGERYNGFNLVFGDSDALWYFSNRAEPGGKSLAAGLYGLSNHLLDTPWPKVARGKSALKSALDALPDATPLFDLLHDERPAEDAALPRTGISLKWERLLSAAFVRAAEYGTRSSTVVLRQRNGQVQFIEQNFAADGEPTERREHWFRVVSD